MLTKGFERVNYGAHFFILLANLGGPLGNFAPTIFIEVFLFFHEAITTCLLIGKMSLLLSHGSTCSTNGSHRHEELIC